MRELVFLSMCMLVSFMSVGQHQVRIRAGSLSTKTSVSEYDRGEGYFYYDSVRLTTRNTMPLINVEVDIDLGKSFYLTTGLGYSEKGLPGVHYINGDYWYSGKQKYLGLILQLKYHYKLSQKKLGFFAATGVKNDLAVGGPNNAEVANVAGEDFFHAFGTFKVAEFSFSTVVGISYRFGPGEIILNADIQNGLTDVFSDRFVLGTTFSVGGSLGYSFYMH